MPYWQVRPKTRAAISAAGLGPRLGFLFCLGGAQGLIGWWMVKSGLEHTHVLGIERSEHDMPRVSPYRLATHLSFAFVTYGLLFWTACDLLGSKQRHTNAVAELGRSSMEVVRTVRALRRGAIGAAAVVGITVFSGAFVAGNLAGLMYNDWPLMAGQFVPAGISEDWDRFSPRGRNFFENMALVQFDHRYQATIILGNSAKC